MYSGEFFIVKRVYSFLGFFLWAGTGLATLPRFEPVRSATGLSTPHPSGTQLCRIPDYAA